VDEGRIVISRIDKIKSQIALVRSNFFDLYNQSGLGDSEREHAFALMTRIGRLTKDLSLIGADEQAFQVERDRVRPLFAEVRRFALRHHIMLAKPLWGWPPVQMNPSALTYTGRKDLVAQISCICRDLKLEIKTGGVQWGPGQQLWNRLREAPVGLFDLREREGSHMASAAYALGLALTLEVSPVVIAEVNTELPFDFDIPPVCLDGSSSDELALVESIDRAFVTFPRIGVQSSVNEMLVRLSEQASCPDPVTQFMKKRILEGRVTDPLEALAVAESLLSGQKNFEAALLRPMWPGFYSDRTAPRCFHVMPFSTKWSDRVKKIVSRVCEKYDVLYRRGDLTDESRIILAIWTEICRASHVIVDITDLNVNVCLELGLAHALGRRTLLLHRSDAPFRPFPEISKLHVDLYDEKNLGSIVEGFIRSSNPIQTGTPANAKDWDRLLTERTLS
jgi:hypothetical protein